MSKYNDLQKEATKLGISAFGKKTEELEDLIKEFKLSGSTNGGELPPTPPQTPNDIPEAPIVPEEKPLSQVSVKGELKPNTAIILDGNHEVRRYELAVHGENFIELAEQFATNRKYKIKFENIMSGLICPACGHKFSVK